MFSAVRNASLGLAAALCALAASPPARATIITLHLSATYGPEVAPAACAPSGCTLSGDIVIDNSPGAANSGFVSADLAASGFSPSVSLPTSGGLLGQRFGLTPNTVFGLGALTLYFDLPTAGSFEGYTGGPLSLLPETDLGFFGSGPVWALISGSLTPTAATTPEPASLTLLVMSLAGLGMVLRTRRT